MILGDSLSLIARLLQLRPGLKTAINYNVEAMRKS